MAQELFDHLCLHSKANHNIGVICQNHRMYGDAIKAYQQSLRDNPSDDETRYNLALCNRRLGRLPQAKEAIDRALALDGAPDVDHLKFAVELYYRMELPEYENLLEQLRQVNPAKAALTEAGLK